MKVELTWIRVRLALDGRMDGSIEQQINGRGGDITVRTTSQTVQFLEGEV